MTECKNDKNPILEEVNILLEEYKHLNAENQARHAHRYHFHYMVLVIIGAVTAAYIGINNDAFKSAIFLSLPIVFFPIIMLMLKEHAYIDLRISYIENVLRHRIRDLLNKASKPVHAYSHILAWQTYEQEVLRKDTVRFVIFGMFGLSEYFLPFILSVASMIIFISLNLNDEWKSWELIIFIIDSFLIIGAGVFLVVSRIRMPHIPKEFAVRKPQH